MSADDFIVTPWHVEGDIDYDKLIKKFGTEKISSEILKRIKKITGEDHFMLRRGIFFSHREMNRILEDDEKFYSKPNLTLEDKSKFAYENALDFIALGFKPNNTKIIINTKNIQTLYPIAAQVAKKINFSNTKAVFGFTNETNIGMIFYTSLQSAPCFIEDKPVLIPLGVDQDPHFRLTRDIAPKIGKPKPALIHN